MRPVHQSGLGLVACVCLCCTVQPLLAATAVSPQLNGDWTGSASGNTYHHQDSSSTSPLVEPAKATATATIVQAGNDLTIAMQITPTGEAAFAISFAGKAGDFAFWGRGSFIDSGGTVEEVFASGHFTAKGNKIVGNMLFGGNDITYVGYSLTKTTTAALTRADRALGLISVTASNSTDPPFNVAGKASGKTYTFATNAKAAKYSAAVTGAFVPATSTASFTFAAADGTQTFDTMYGDAEKASAFLGQGGSENIIMFLKTSTSSGSGTGWIFGDTRMVEFKISAKKQ